MLFIYHAYIHVLAVYLTQEPSLISRTISVDVKHHVYLLQEQAW